ncbi:ABC transporter permease [Clostridium tagluense]|uniref:FtsX-like permease family protein n=1 Tax=Clostridium tagluense TaxID=360422 RepID=UPI001CF142F7|nr:FtsX-like permease family protein [Clostridium tagluense]MCB2313682.1 ABC transporter permease [Clostridium tagluense]MCB2318762.1 ABC transporter permease [Clostridium tagluense]MCB2323612.1 ABC transporter permease [Clostridium tagluense]MCB2328537.1 ABC transporter permease [Clostridium tagluense]MCB2333006.1 ABC transporter permease [Clostridium tagluense]
MKTSTLNLLLKDASKNLRNNATTSIASIATIMSTLFILGIFILFMLNLKMGIIGIYTQFEVRATLKDDIKITDQQNICKKIKAANVVTYITFEKNTPLSAYIIKVNAPEDIPKIISQLNGLQGINKINSTQNFPSKILIMIKAIQGIGVILFLILIVATFFLIKSTMKLAIHPRINEISIMQYLGATDWFIRWPFIFEGIIIGFLGAVSAVIAIFFLYSFVYRQINSYFATLFINFINPSFIFTTMSWSFILIGIILTTIGRILVMKKFLII